MQIGMGPMFSCICKVQDGRESWIEASIEDAISSMIGAARVLNGSTISVDDIKFINCDTQTIKQFDFKNTVNLKSLQKLKRRIVI